MAGNAQFLLTGRRMLATLGCALVAAVATGIVVLHGGGSGTAEAAEATAPSCASAEQKVPPPAEVPAAVLPPGTILTSVRHPRAGATLVTGVVASPFRSAVEFFVVGLPAAGYVNTTGDAEMDEAESSFRGASLRGKWKVNGILGCAHAVRLALLVTT